jgi:hypothetical protein
MSIQRSLFDNNKLLNLQTKMPRDDDNLPGKGFPRGGRLTPGEVELPGRRNPNLPYKPYEEDEGAPSPAAPEQENDDSYEQPPA